MPIDPVCHLSVDARNATERGLVSPRDGDDRRIGDMCYFCSPTCKELYDLHPAQYPGCRAKRSASQRPGEPGSRLPN